MMSTSMKTILRVPTKNQYGYIEVEHDYNSFDEAHEAYKEALATVNEESGEGLPDKEFKDFIDRQLSEQPGNTIDMYNAMNPEQQKIVQTIKLSIKRLKSREENI